MTCVSRLVEVRTKGRGLYDVTEHVRQAAEFAAVRTGVVHVFVRHTSASLVIQENADPAVLRDLSHWLDGLAPEEGKYEHEDEGKDDMPSHLRSAITRTTETIPIGSGKLLLGTWQAVYLWEHRRAPHRRELVLTVMGE